MTSSVTTSNGGTSSKMAGGLVGGSFACCGGNSTLTDSFSTSGVSASVVSDSLFIGGLMAYNSGSIASCYALGKVSVNGGSTNTIGGLVGRNDTGGSITSSYWDANQTGVNIGVGSGANTGGTSWIVAPTTMPAGFDSAKWGLAPTVDNGHPYLLWQSAFNLLAPALTTVSVYDLFAPTTSYTSVNSNGPLYNSFSAGSAPVVLNDVQVNIQLLGSPEGSVNVGLYADNQGQPGTQLFKLGSISDAMITNVPSDYSFPVPGGFTLAPNTQYWIGLSATGSNAAWASTASSAGIGVFGGFNCHFTVAAGMVCVSNFTDPFLMAVSGAPAP